MVILGTFVQKNFLNFLLKIRISYKHFTDVNVIHGLQRAVIKPLYFHKNLNTFPHVFKVFVHFLTEDLSRVYDNHDIPMLIVTDRKDEHPLGEDVDFLRPAFDPVVAQELNCLVI